MVCPNKCPFCPLCVEVLKREIQNIEKVGCYHYALISYFWHKKYVTDIFWGSDASIGCGSLGVFFVVI
jgi:hypothetical protein